MKEIGKKLAAERKKRKLSYDDISEATKMPIGHLKAIEDGDLDYFKDNLTYVRFYVRSYCKALGVPYEKMKDDVLESVDEYTNTLTLKALEEQEAMEANIHDKSDHKESNGPLLAKKDRQSILQNAKQNVRFRKVKRFDYAFLSLIIVSVLIVLLVLYVGVSSLLSKKDNDNVKQDPVVEKDNKPTPEVEKPKEEKPEEPVVPEEEVNAITFVKESAGVYVVNGLKVGEEITFDVSFPTASQFNMWTGNTGIAGAYHMANANETYTTKATATSSRVIYTLNFWNYQNNVIKVNGVELKLDEVPAAKDGVTYITLKVTGEANESTE